MPLNSRARFLGLFGGVGGVLAGYPFWRLKWLDTLGDIYCGLGHLRFKDSLGNNQSLNGTAAASDTWGGSPSNAFIEPYDTANYWSANTNTRRNDWISYHFQNNVIIKAIDIAPSGTNTRIPGAFVIEYSSDGIVWNPAWYGGNDTLASYTIREITAKSKVAWRIDIDSVDGGTDTSLAELWFNAVSGVDDARSIYRGFADTENTVTEGNWSRSAFDGDPSTRWFSDSVLDLTTGNYLIYIKDDITDVSEVAIQAHPTNPSTSPKDFRISYWDIDLEQWVQALEVTGEVGWTNNEIRRFQIV
jgi:hypothetical protein